MTLAFVKHLIRHHVISAATARAVCLCGSLVVVAACDSDDGRSLPVPHDLPIWEFSPEPALSIGVQDGDPNYQLFRVPHALRLEDGSIVVVNAGTAELRYFDERGRFYAKAGGRGDGPSEFRRLRTAFAFGPDSIMAYDEAGRSSYFDRNGTLLGSVNVPYDEREFLPSRYWLYRRALVHAAPDRERRPAIARSIDRLPKPPARAAYHYIRVATDGLLWVSDGVDRRGERSGWTIYDSSGAAVGWARLPERFNLFEVTDRDAIGRWRDENDVEFVRVYDYTKPDVAPAVRSGPPTGARPEDPVDLSESPFLEALQGLLRQAVTMQERYFYDHRRYTAKGSDLDWELPEGMVVDFIEVSGTGWLAIAGHADYPFVCAIGLGSHTPPGWTEGAPHCGDSAEW